MAIKISSEQDNSHCSKSTSQNWRHTKKYSRSARKKTRYCFAFLEIVTLLLEKYATDDVIAETEFQAKCFVQLPNMTPSRISKDWSRDYCSVKLCSGLMPSTRFFLKFRTPPSAMNCESSVRMRNMQTCMTSQSMEGLYFGSGDSLQRPNKQFQVKWNLITNTENRGCLTRQAKAPREAHQLRANQLYEEHKGYNIPGNDSHCKTVAARIQLWDIFLNRNPTRSANHEKSCILYSELEQNAQNVLAHFNTGEKGNCLDQLLLRQLVNSKHAPFAKTTSRAEELFVS